MGFIIVFINRLRMLPCGRQSAERTECLLLFLYTIMEKGRKYGQTCSTPVSFTKCSPKGVRVTNWNNKNGKALFWIRLLSENSGYLLLYAETYQNMLCPSEREEYNFFFLTGGYIVESQFLVSLTSHKASILILLCLTPMTISPSLWKLAWESEVWLISTIW